MENNYLKLADIPTGEECVIVKVHGHGSFRNRIVEMGFVKGEKVTVIKNAPLHDPIEYKLMDGHISLRRSEARLIEVVCTSSIDQEGYNGTFTEDEIAREISEKLRGSVHGVNSLNAGMLQKQKNRSISLWLGIRIVGRLLSLTGLPDCAKEWGIIAE